MGVSSRLESVEVLLETPDYLVLNKPCRKHFDEVLTQSVNKGVWVPAHRLDFETSGCLLFCRPEKLASFRAYFQSRPPELEKLYLAGASRRVDELENRESLEATGFIGGRYRSSKKVRFATEATELKGYHGVQAVSHRVSRAQAARPDAWEGEVYRVRLFSGARHQIRAWFAAQGAPLVGDPVYGDAGERLELHAERLAWIDPESRRPYEATAPVR